MSVHKRVRNQKSKACPPCEPPAVDLCADLQDFYMCRRPSHPPSGGETLTEQSHKAHVDVNNIMARYTRSGVMEHIRRFEGQYADVSDMDYHEAMTKVADTKSMFEEMPSTMRRHFNDDVAQFLEFSVSENDPTAKLQAIAEEYRKQALGVGNGESIGDPNTPPGKAVHVDAQDSGKDPAGEGNGD